MKRISDLRSGTVDSGFVRELNERLRALEEAVSALEGQGGKTPTRKHPLVMDSQEIRGVSRILFSTPVVMSLLNHIEFTPDESDTISADDLAEVVIPEIYKALNTLVVALRQVQQTLNQRGLVVVR